jgi:hypothetical protein
MRWAPFIYLTALFLLAGSSGFAQAYKPPKVDKPAFDLEEIGLMEVERQKFATNLAGFVVNEIKVKENAHRAEWARKLIGLALHLDKRNRTALVANHQFKRGVEPKKVQTDYKPQPLATLLIAKSKSLKKLGGIDNIYLSGLLLAAAVEMDPVNEDAVFELELYKLDIGEIDWDPVTDGEPRKPLKGSVAKDK